MVPDVLEHLICRTVDRHITAGSTTSCWSTKHLVVLLLRHHSTVVLLPIILLQVLEQVVRAGVLQVPVVVLEQVVHVGLLSSLSWEIRIPSIPI